MHQFRQHRRTPYHWTNKISNQKIIKPKNCLKKKEREREREKERDIERQRSKYGS